VPRPLNTSAIVSGRPIPTLVHRAQRYRHSVEGTLDAARLALNLTPFKVTSISSGVALDHQLGPLSRPPREQEDRHAVQRRESEQPPAVVGVQCPARQQHGRNAEQQQRQWRGDRRQRQHRGQQPEAGNQPPHRPAALIGRRQPC